MAIIVFTYSNILPVFSIGRVPSIGDILNVHIYIITIATESSIASTGLCVYRVDKLPQSIGHNWWTTFVISICLMQLCRYSMWYISSEWNVITTTIYFFTIFIALKSNGDFFPMSFGRSSRNDNLPSGFVKMSATILLVGQYHRSMFFPMCSRRKW